MFSSALVLSLLARHMVAAAQSTVDVVCVAGQCLEGFANLSIGTTISASGAPASLLLLPGTYTESTNPELLHELLTSSSASLHPSVGFANASSSSSSSVSLPFTVALQPGLATYAESLYSGDSAFVQLPTTSVGNSSTGTPLTAGSFALASNVWAAISASSSKQRTIVWSSVPDITQLPSSAFSGSLSLLDLQSNACSPPCSGSGVCSASGTCTCPTGFNGTSCETCAPNFFGPDCTACPADCTECDDGTSGTGKCLVPTVANPPSSCNCVNGVCGSDGKTCACSAGFTTASNGTQCAACQKGFFLSGGNCAVCALGCEECADDSGDCITCRSGFTQNANDATQCIAPQTTTSGGTTCPDGSFSNGTACVACSPECQTCSGPDSTDCIICGTDKYSVNGSCVTTNADGVCDGSNLIANNNKHECDTCPSKCTTCQIPNFSVASTINQAQCTGCLPGFVLSQGACVESCPTGTFLSPTDNLTCTACDSSCSTCVGSASFCLSCANNQLAFNGQCVSTCPSSSFSSSGRCLTCHPDCDTCTGSSFNQCASCGPNLPVLTNGRCLPTCSENQFFDTTSSSCQSCDSSCSSCSGSGPSSCLACSDSNSVLRAGSCVAANCNASTSVIPALGVCLSELVNVPPSSSSASASLPSITGISAPTTVVVKKQPLAWWEILLMALGCAFIFMVVMWWWRRRARKQRANKTAAFAKAKALDRRPGWKTRLVNFGERLFGHRKPWGKNRGPIALQHDNEEIRLRKLRAAEEAERDSYVEKLLDSYEYPRAGSDNGSTSPGTGRRSQKDRERLRSLRNLERQQSVASSLNSWNAPSMYSEVTGNPRRAPEPREPVKTSRRDRERRDVSRFSGTTHQSNTAPSDYQPTRHLRNLTPPRAVPTPAEEYASSMMTSTRHQSPIAEPGEIPPGAYWLEPVPTGLTTTSSNEGASNNPFRKQQF